MTTSSHFASPVSAVPGADRRFYERLIASARLACYWLVDVAQVKSPKLSGMPIPELSYENWQGAIRGEYRAADRQWSFFGPYWHTGQAVKALVMFHDIDPDPRWEQGAIEAGDFMLRHQIMEQGAPDFGLPLAYEDVPEAVNTSAVLEGLEGLFHLETMTGDSVYAEAADAALRWVAQHAYVKGEGTFHDFYDVATRRFVPLSFYRSTDRSELPRPLLDDGVFLRGYYKTGCQQYRDIFFETAEELIRTERPSGNWVMHGPCHEGQGFIHPRHAYWWGAPMLDAWRESGEQRFLDMALRSADWYSKALRRDGGFFRHTGLDFNSNSFNHATSGSACAAIFFLRLSLEAGDHRFLDQAVQALNYCMEAQFIHPEDANLKGAILEKVMPPDGSDRSPFHIRDLGTTFFIQAAALAHEVFNPRFR